MGTSEATDALRSIVDEPQLARESLQHLFRSHFFAPIEFCCLSIGNGLVYQQFLITFLIMSSAPIVFLVDNGSLRASATLELRQLAASLMTRMGLTVEAVSLLHSHKIEPAQLAGVPATIVRRRLRELVAAGARDFVILPLFLGPSLALADYLPKLVREVQQAQPAVSVKIAAPLAGHEVAAPDLRLAKMLSDHVRALIHARGWATAKVALVDHGTPALAVNEVRNAVAQQLQELLAKEGWVVKACSMERRAGDEYAFNEPLLEHAGQIPELAAGNLVVALFFLLPGRHAGAGGDVAEICDSLIAAGDFAAIATTPLLAQHPLMLELLEDRLRAVL
jgi:sirohydrochlorin ferrochelatase